MQEQNTTSRGLHSMQGVPPTHPLQSAGSQGPGSELNGCCVQGQEHVPGAAEKQESLPRPSGTWRGPNSVCRGPHRPINHTPWNPNSKDSLSHLRGSLGGEQWGGGELHQVPQGGVHGGDRQGEVDPQGAVGVHSRGAVAHYVAPAALVHNLGPGVGQCSTKDVSTSGPGSVKLATARQGRRRGRGRGGGTREMGGTRSTPQRQRARQRTQLL